MIPKSINIIDNIIKKDNNIDGIIVGVKDLSTNYKVALDIDDIKTLNYDKKIFLVMNKVMFNSDINNLEKVLTQISNLNIAGVMFYDLSILSIVKRLNLNINLIWNQTHMVTNYNTCNYYYNMGVEGVYLANELTIDEMIKIKEETNGKVFCNIISKPIMSHSRRKLLTNYFHSINDEKTKDVYEIKESISNHKYLVVEEESGTSIIYNNIVNGIKPLFEMIENNFDYGIIDTSYLTSDEIKNAISLVEKIENNEIKKEDAIEESNKVLGNDTGFFYKKTIYKVK